MYNATALSNLIKLFKKWFTHKCKKSCISSRAHFTWYLLVSAYCSKTPSCNFSKISNRKSQVIPLLVSKLHTFYPPPLPFFIVCMFGKMWKYETTLPLVFRFLWKVFFNGLDHTNGLPKPHLTHKWFPNPSGSSQVNWENVPNYKHNTRTHEHTNFYII